jgi:hypothetical protein
MVWLASKFGVTLSAKQIFITPAPAKPKTSVEGIDIVDFVDPILASRAARQALAGDDLRDLESMPADNESDDGRADVADAAKALVAATGPVEGPATGPAAPAVAAAAAEIASPSAGLKRSATAAAPKAPKKKTVKLEATEGPTVEEDF